MVAVMRIGFKSISSNICLRCSLYFGGGKQTLVVYSKDVDGCCGG